jgi:hypothetical protein
LLRALPGDRAFLPPSPVQRVSVVAALTSASRRQDHTTSPSAATSFVFRHRCVHRIPHRRIVTIAKRPSHGRGMARGYKDDLPDGQSKIFLRGGVDSKISVDCVDEMRFLAQSLYKLMSSFRGARRASPESIYPRCPAAISGYKSIHCGLVSSISRIFQSGRHFFNSFSREIAVTASSSVSNQTSLSTECRLVKPATALLLCSWTRRTTLFVTPRYSVPYLSLAER